MSWFWIAMAAAAPLLLALLIGLPFWLSGAHLGGNLVGTAVVIISAIAAVVREQGEVQQILIKCVRAGKPCLVHPGPFTRFAVYGAIGMAQVCLLFVISLWIEERQRRREFSGEWR